jgi:ATP-binding cassette subfamily B multidrug efflux pump
VGVVAAATALTLRLNAMTGWIMWALSSFFRSARRGGRGDGDDHPADHLTDARMRRRCEVAGARSRSTASRTITGAARAGLTGSILTIRPGEKVGLVGRSGAGKSTLVKLLLRFYDVEGGRILIDGQDIAAVTQDSLRHQIGMVQQDSALLHRSVRDNILYGRPEATEEEMIAAAERAEAHDFILDPRSAGARGLRRRGGRTRREAVGRAAAARDAGAGDPEGRADPDAGRGDISALDSEVEAAIQETLYGVMEGKTVIAIAHRLSTIAHMDRIVVMDEGRIAEEGTHAELLAKGFGLYAGFWARQSGGFIGGWRHGGRDASYPLDPVERLETGKPYEV